MALLGTLQVRMGLDTATFTQGFNRFQRNLNGRVRKFQRNLQGLTSIGAAGLTVGLTSGLRTATQSAFEFSDVMLDVEKNVKGLDATGARTLREQILGLGQDSILGSTGIARLVSEAGKLGEASKGAFQFSKLSQEIAVAFDFGRNLAGAQEAGRIVGKLRSGFQLTTNEVRELADAINFFGDNTASNPLAITNVLVRQGSVLANTTKLTRNEIAALAATIEASAPSSEIAATGLKNFILALTSGNAATDAQSARFKQLGFDTEELAKRMQTDAVPAILEVLKSLRDLDGADRGAVLRKIFGKESIGAISPLLKNLEELDKNFKLAAGSGQLVGSLRREFDRLNNSDNGKILKALNSFRTQMVRIGLIVLPPLSDGLKRAGDLLQRFGKFAANNEGLVKFGAAATLVVAALPPLGLALTGLAGLVPVVTASFGLLAKGVLALTGPLGLVAAGLFLFKDEIFEFARSVPERIRNLVDTVQGYFNQWRANNAELIANLSSAWQGLREAGANLRNTLVTSLSEMGTALARAFGGNSTAVVTNWGAIFSKVLTTGVTFLTAAITKVTEFANWLSVQIPSAVDTVSNFLSPFFKFLGDSFRGLTDVLNGNKSVWFALGELIGTVVRNIIDTVKQVPDQVSATFTEASDYLANLDWGELGKNLIDGLVNGIKERAKSALDAVVSIGESLSKGFRVAMGIESPSKVFREYGGFIVEGLAQGMDSSVAVKTSQKMAQDVSKSFQDEASKGGVDLSGLAKEGRKFSKDGFSGVARRFLPRETQIKAEFERARKIILEETTITEAERTVLLERVATKRQEQLDGLAKSGVTFGSTWKKAVGQLDRSLDEFARSGSVKLENLVGTAVQLVASLAGGGGGFGGSGGNSTASTISAIAGIFGGFRADGGPVSRGSAYVVGERGPELFSPRRSGNIIPTEALASAGGGGMTVNETYNISSGVTPQELRLTLEELERSRQLRERQSYRNGDVGRREYVA